MTILRQRYGDSSTRIYIIGIKTETSKRNITHAYIKYNSINAGNSPDLAVIWSGKNLVSKKIVEK